MLSYSLDLHCFLFRHSNIYVCHKNCHPAIIIPFFQDPYVIDIKMGTRTFLESEVSKSSARPDLYQKMVAIDPDAPTPEEHQAKAVTKLRYMQFREQQSSTCSQGFRIEAMKCRGSPPSRTSNASSRATRSSTRWSCSSAPVKMSASAC